MGVRPPAVRGHDRLGVGQQLLRVVLVPAWLDREVGVALIEHSPQRTTLPGGTPARLVHVQRLGGAQPAKKIIMGLGQRRSGPGEDRVHRARADASAKQLFDELDGVLPGNPVAHRQRRHGPFKARTEGTARRLLGQRRTRAYSTRGAAQTLAPVLGHPDGDRRQLFDLVTRRLADRVALIA
jgi:hypothetical protein